MGSFRNPLDTDNPQANFRFDFTIIAWQHIRLWGKWLGMGIIRMIAAPVIPGRSAFNVSGELSRKSTLWRRNVWDLVT